MNVLDLEGKVIVITKWSLELRRVNSNEVFTSYNGVECRLIVHNFRPQLKESLHPTRCPTNLYRDDEFKTTIQAFRHAQVCAAAASKKVDMAPLSGGKGQVSQGVLTNSVGEWQFKEGNTKVVQLGGAKKDKATAQAVKSTGKKAAPKKAVKASAKKSKAVDALMAAGKKSGKKSEGGKKSASARPPATPDGKRTGTNSKMTVRRFKKFMAEMHPKKK